jgi:hypothetical protein
VNDDGEPCSDDELHSECDDESSGSDEVNTK